MVVAALSIMAAFTSASAVAQMACVDDHQMAMAPQEHPNRPDSRKSHDCANACPLMCGAVSAEQTDLTGPMLAASPGAAVTRTEWL
jgi:hypothetical protein